MNGPSKDAGVERIAPDDVAWALTGLRLHIIEGRYTHSSGGETLQPLHDRVDRIEAALLSLLPHPPVDPAAEEVARELHSRSKGLFIDDVVLARGATLIRSQSARIAELEGAAGDLEAATLIRSQSARIAELEGALRYVIDVREIKCATQASRADDFCARCRADAALAPSVASETKARAVLGEVERG
jgi:hypothetical protein